MNAAETIEALRHGNNYLPEKALQAATEHWPEIRPYLLKELSKTPQDISNQNDDLFFFAMFLAAEMRDTAAYPLLIDFFSTTGEVAADAMGDAVTESLWKILASTYDGDLAPLKALAEKKGASIWCRCAAMETFLVLLNKGVLKRDEVVDYFRHLFQIISEDGDNYFNSSLVCCCTTIHPAELMDDIRHVFKRCLVDPAVIGLQEVEQALIEQSPQDFADWERDKYRFIGRTADELRHWHGFSEEYRKAKRIQEKKQHMDHIIQPVRQTQKIGRNAPCPCGSGKKFKKCCGAPGREVH